MKTKISEYLKKHKVKQSDIYNQNLEPELIKSNMSYRVANGWSMEDMKDCIIFYCPKGRPFYHRKINEG